MRKVELLPTWDCEAGYGPGREDIFQLPCSHKYKVFLNLNLGNEFRKENKLCQFL